MTQRCRQDDAAEERPGGAPLLLVDADVAFRDAVSGALVRFSIDVEWRARLHGLSDAIATLDPIALALSLDLAGGDAIDALRSIRDRDAWAGLPVILVGNAPTREEILEALAAGADAVLPRRQGVAEIAARALGALARHGRTRRSRARAAADEILEMCDLSRTIDDPDRLAADRPSGASSPASTPFVPPATLDTAAADASPVLPTIRPATLAAVPEVILVEDDPSLLEMLRYALSNRGYQTLSFANGLDALRALREMDTAGRRPVVLLDVDLPGIDGFRILHELAGSRPGDYQVILCTVHNSEATQVLGIQSGALDYLVKPLRIPIVLAKVERLIGRSPLGSAAAHG